MKDAAQIFPDNRQLIYYNKVLYIAIENPKNFHALDEVQMISRMDVQPMLASGKSITTHLDKLYGNEHTQRALSDYSKEESFDEVVSQVLEASTDGLDNADRKSVV